ncbi:superinfection immunity protein [Oecophyllibacter saccharovorans]|uniref:superinfection immunity protein n=1 Tax=Oecophyllibacter saccharovorans TaxID=2558360 RepID=UPI001174A7A3|nr:superinfection immunity protein [Oecophyllibacter saccharovorans]TPW35200.1 hypothetical protein E3203_06990 [Oecophyllibacter saccharovorans]
MFSLATNSFVGLSGAMVTFLSWLLWPMEILFSPHSFLSGLPGLAKFVGVLLLILAGLALLWFYFLPSSIFFWRGLGGSEKRRPLRLIGMAVLNLLLGWTGFGWLSLLTMACTLPRSRSRGLAMKDEGAENGPS